MSVHAATQMSISNLHILSECCFLNPKRTQVFQEVEIGSSLPEVRCYPFSINCAVELFVSNHLLTPGARTCD
jgi:hypothetical protein